MAGLKPLTSVTPASFATEGKSTLFPAKFQKTNNGIVYQAA